MPSKLGFCGPVSASSLGEKCMGNIWRIATKLGTRNVGTVERKARSTHRQTHHHGDIPCGVRSGLLQHTHTHVLTGNNWQHVVTSYKDTDGAGRPQRRKGISSTTCADSLSRLLQLLLLVAVDEGGRDDRNDIEAVHKNQGAEGNVEDSQSTPRIRNSSPQAFQILSRASLLLDLFKRHTKGASFLSTSNCRPFATQVTLRMQQTTCVASCLAHTLASAWLYVGVRFRPV